MATNKRRILRRFRITEISAVDNPAQEGARAVIMKRADAPTGAPTGASTEVDVNRTVAEIRARDGVGHVEALRKACDERPELFEDVPLGPPAAAPVAQGDGVADFEARVRELEDEGLPPVEALRQARALYPAEFDRYQAA